MRLVDVSGWQKWHGSAVLGFAFALSLDNSFSPLQLQGLAVGIPLILCYIQSVNDCFDVEIDKIKEKTVGKRLIVSNIISKKAALTITFSILAVGLVSAAIGSASLLLIALLMAFLGTIYSAPPFRLKMKYPFSTLIQFAGCFLPFLAGVASITTVTVQAIVISSIFAVLAMIHRFRHEIQNYRVDLLTEKRTVAVVKGLRAAETFYKLSAILGVVEFLVFFVLGWLDLVFLFLFVLYLVLTVAPWIWVRSVPRSLGTIANLITMFSSFVLIFFLLIVYGIFH